MADFKGGRSLGPPPKVKNKMFSSFKNIVSHRSKSKDNGTNPPEKHAVGLQSLTDTLNVSRPVEDKTQLLHTATQSATPINYAASTGQTVVSNLTATPSDLIFVLPESNTALEGISVSKPINEPSDNPQTPPSGGLPSQVPIHELWNEAYEDLRNKEEKLIKDYEAALSDNVGKQIGSTLAVTGSSIAREDAMARVLNQKMEEVKKNTWRLKFGSQEVAIKDLAEPVVGIINWADDYISNALSANPYASIAWAGVSLLLPLVLNPSKQAASLVKGLGEISNLIARSTMRENLYARRYESEKKKQVYKDFLRSHMIYRDTLKELYTRVLKFQARSLCYYSENGLLRLGSDIVKWSDWDSLLADIQAQEIEFGLVYEGMKDIRYQEESEALDKRQKESMSMSISIASNVSGLRKAIENAQEDSRRSALLNWLSAIDPSENHRTALGKCKADTGSWLLQNHEGFARWKNAPNSLLWLHGKAGSGKSVLCSSVVKGLEDSFNSDPEIAIAYFYFSFNDREKQKTDVMLCSLIKQLCCQRPDTPPSINTLQKDREKGHRPDTTALEKALLATMRGFSSVFLVIDALDECPHEDEAQSRENLLDSLSRIHGAVFANLHMFCTSRSIPDIEAVLKPLISLPTAIEIDLEGSSYKDCVTEDINLYLDQVFASANYKHWPEDVKAEAKDTLIEKANGMFQYVACQLDILRRLQRAGEIRKALKGLPKGLDATYDRMLDAIMPENRKQVASMLKWLSFSLRPLLLDELAEIFILDHGSDLPFDYTENRLFNVEVVLKYIPSLVTNVPTRIHQYSYEHFTRRGERVSEIRLAHFSIKEYLVSNRITQGPAKDFSFDEMNAHLHIADSCLAYNAHLSKSIVATEETIQQFRLWEYAAKNWAKHLENVSEGSWPASIISRIIEVFTTGKLSLLNLIRIHDPDRREPNLDIASDMLPTPLYYAASIDAPKLVEFLIQRGAKVDEFSQFTEYGTVLQAAATNREDMVRLLLDRAADATVQGGKYGTALQAAVVFGEESTVQLLLDRGADVNIQGGKFGTALQAAVAHGEDMVRLLLDRGADVNVQGGEFGTALQAAVAHGEDMVRLLLDRGADVNVQGGEFGTALQAAVAAYRKESTVQLLLDRGANVNVQGGIYGTALQAAVVYGEESTVQLLLGSGADVNAQGGKYGTALQAAVVHGEESTVQLLLDRGADFNVQGGIYGTALQAALAAYRKESTVQLLLDRGVDVNMQGGIYGTALQAAVVYREESTVQLLIDRGADVNAQGGEYRTALQAAAAYGEEDIVQLLLDRGADAIIQGGRYGNALQAAIANNKPRIAKLLLSRGAKLDPPGAKWDALLAGIAEIRTRNEARRLRDYREDPRMLEFDDESSQEDSSAFESDGVSTDSDSTI